MKVSSFVLLTLLLVTDGAQAQEGGIGGGYTYEGSPFAPGQLTTPEGEVVPTDPTGGGGFIAHEQDGSIDQFYNDGGLSGELIHTPGPDAFGNTPCCNNPAPGSSEENDIGQ